MAIKNNQIFALAIMPFSKEFDDFYFLGIKETAARHNIVVERLDEQLFYEGMMQRLYDQIDRADFIIADLSNRNPNVFYELGYAHAKNKLCILLTSSSKDMPFDLQHYRNIIYDNSLIKLRKSLERELLWVKKVIQEEDNTIKVSHNSEFIEIIEKEYSRRASIKIFFDINNLLSERSIDIHGIYLYLTDETWMVEQNQVYCPRNSSDINGYTYRFFIKPALKILGAGAWLPCEFIGSKVLINRWDPNADQLPSEVTEPCILRIITDSSPIDYSFNIDIDIDLPLPIEQ